MTYRNKIERKRQKTAIRQKKKITWLHFLFFFSRRHGCSPNVKDEVTTYPYVYKHYIETERRLLILLAALVIIHDHIAAMPYRCVYMCVVDYLAKIDFNEPLICTVLWSNCSRSVCSEFELDKFDTVVHSNIINC